jgi:WD40 repeat protein
MQAMGSHHLEGEKDPDGRAFVAWSPDGTKLASVIFGESAPIRIWSAKDDRYQLLAVSSSASFYAIAWSPDSSKLFVAGIIASYIFYDLTPDHPQSRVIGPFVISVGWSPDGSKLAGGSVDGPIYILDATTGQRLATLEGHQGVVEAVAWSPDGQTLASASYDNTVRIWDPATGKVLDAFPITNDSKRISSLIAWSPYGGRLTYAGGVASSAVARTRTLVGGAVHMVVPAPTVEKLQTITKGCAKADVQQRLASRLDTTKLSDFIAEVKRLPKEQIPPACAADLIAVAEVLQKKQ